MKSSPQQKMMGRKGAIELTMGTVVIIVLGVTMLILGMVLVRSIMCSGLSLTNDVNGKMTSELENYFGQSADEVTCLGEIDPVKIAPGKENFITCRVKAPDVAKYDFSVVSYASRDAGITQAKIQQWIGTQTSQGYNIAPSDNGPKAIFSLKIPADASEGTVTIDITVKKDGDQFREKKLKFTVTRVGFVQATMC